MYNGCMAGVRCEGFCGLIGLSDYATETFFICSAGWGTFQILGEVQMLLETLIY